MLVRMVTTLGIDYGEKRVGLAISGDEGMVAFPLALVANTDELVREIASIVREREVGHIVMGASENPHGAPNPIRERITLCAEALTRATGIEVELVPESYSSAEARRAFEVLAASRATSLPAVDAAAAAIILQSYLDRARAGATDTTPASSSDKADSHTTPPPSGADSTTSSTPSPTHDSSISNPKLTIDEFKRIEVKLGKVLAAEPVPNTDKLLKLSVDFGEGAPRQVVSGIAAHVPDVALLAGKTFPFVTNLEPRMIRGIESQAMILAASNDEGGFAFLEPSTPLAPGTRIV